MWRFLVRVGAIAAKETTHIRRDIATLYMALGMPVVLLLLFGFGVSFDIDRVPLAVADLDRSEASVDLTRAFVASDDFRLVAMLRRPEEAEPLFRRGRASAALVIPRGFERELGRGRVTTVQLLLDGADPMTANMVLARSDAQAVGMSLRIASRQGFALVPPLAVRSWIRFNPEARSSLYLVPGLVVLILAIVAMLLTALTVAREWERGSMEQLFATPVGRLEIVIGKQLPYLGLGIVAVLLVLAVGAWVFDLPFRGDLVLLAVDSLLFLMCMLGLGLLISVVTRSQMLATQVGALATILPNMLLSNFVFPVANMPKVLQWISAAMPASYFMRVLRGILLRGNGVEELWRESLALAGFALGFAALATLRFKRRIA